MEKLYTVSKNQDWGLNVAQIMNFILQNSDLNWGICESSKLKFP